MGCQCIGMGITVKLSFELRKKPAGNCRLPSALIFPIFSYIFRASYFFLYFDPKSYIFPSNSYIFQNAAENNEISRKNHGILV